MLLKDLIRLAVCGGDARAAGAVSDHCRCKLHYTYAQTFDLVKRLHPDVTPAQWDALLQEAEAEETTS